jgi:hypothetical protein
MRRRTIVSTVIVLVSLSAAARELSGQTVPHKGSGTGVYSPISGDYSGSGVATHLGKNTFFGNVAVSPTADPLVYGWQSTEFQETIGANGDTILFSLSGQVQLIPLDSSFTTFSAIWSGEVVVQGGTGRFSNVGPGTQPLKLIAINDPFTFADPEWTFSWTLDGTITLH